MKDPHLIAAEWVAANLDALTGRELRLVLEQAFVAGYNKGLTTGSTLETKNDLGVNLPPFSSWP